MLKAEGYRIVAIDQHTEAVATEQKRGWFPVNMFGAVTDDGDRFVALTPDRFNAAVAKRFLRAVLQEFGEKTGDRLGQRPLLHREDAAEAGRPAACFWRFCRHIHQR